MQSILILRPKQIRYKMRRIFKAHTSFGYAAVTAIVIGVGDLIATGTDIVWLIGDMSHGAHLYHWFVGIGLGVAELIMFASFLWLFKSIYCYVNNRSKKELQKAKNMRRRFAQPRYSCSNRSRDMTKAQLALVPDLSEE